MLVGGCKAAPSLAKPSSARYARLGFEHHSGSSSTTVDLVCSINTQCTFVAVVVPGQSVWPTCFQHIQCLRLRVSAVTLLLCPSELAVCTHRARHMHAYRCMRTLEALLQYTRHSYAYNVLHCFCFLQHEGHPLEPCSLFTLTPPFSQLPHPILSSQPNTAHSIGKASSSQHKK